MHAISQQRHDGNMPYKVCRRFSFLYLLENRYSCTSVNIDLVFTEEEKKKGGGEGEGLTLLGDNRRKSLFHFTNMRLRLSYSLRKFNIVRFLNIFVLPKKKKKKS